MVKRIIEHVKIIMIEKYKSFFEFEIFSLIKIYEINKGNNLER